MRSTVLLLILTLCLTLGCGGGMSWRDGFALSIGQTDVIIGGGDAATEEGEGSTGLGDLKVAGEALSVPGATVLAPIVGLAARVAGGFAGVPVPPVPPPDTTGED